MRRFLVLIVLFTFLFAVHATSVSAGSPISTATCPSGQGFQTIYPPHSAGEGTFIQTWGELFCDRTGVVHGVRLYYYYATDHVWRLVASSTHTTTSTYDPIVVNQCSQPSSTAHAWMAKGYVEGETAVWTEPRLLYRRIASDGTCGVALRAGNGG